MSVVPLQTRSVAEIVSSHVVSLPANGAFGRRLARETSVGTSQSHNDVGLEVTLKRLASQAEGIELPVVRSRVAGETLTRWFAEEAIKWALSTGRCVTVLIVPDWALVAA